MKWKDGRRSSRHHRFRQGLEDLRRADRFHILVLCAGRKLHDQQTAIGGVSVEFQGELAIHAADHVEGHHDAAFVKHQNPKVQMVNRLRFSNRSFEDGAVFNASGDEDVDRGTEQGRPLTRRRSPPPAWPSRDLGGEESERRRAGKTPSLRDQVQVSCELFRDVKGAFTETRRVWLPTGSGVKVPPNSPYFNAFRMVADVRSRSVFVTLRRGLRGGRKGTQNFTNSTHFSGRRRSLQQRWLSRLLAPGRRHRSKHCRTYRRPSPTIGPSNRGQHPRSKTHFH